MEKRDSQKVIEDFLNGEDQEEFIVNVEYDYATNLIFKVIQDPKRGKIIREDKFTPFCWVGDLSEMNFYQNSKALQKKKMHEHGIFIEKLDTYGNDRLENGLRYMVKTLKTYTNLISFFKQGGIDPWGDKYKDNFIMLTPVEQYLIQKNKRLFKGFENYDEIHRLVFDIETTGLDPKTDKIILIGVKDNRGFRQTISALGENGEKNCIREFFNIIKELKPTIIGGYNSAEFDFPFIEERSRILGLDINALTQIYTDRGITKKEKVLKLASEVEPYMQYSIWGFSIIDIAHGVRRAQAINSEIKSWGLKYVTKYLEKEKPNRVYVDGKLISKIYADDEAYYLNPKTGGFRRKGSAGTENLLERFPNKFETWTGAQIVEQYLDDDLYETMVADDSFSQSTFLLSKLVPTVYERIATMGTATLWRMIMLAWSYKHNLAVPKRGSKRKFTGGLSRLLKVGFAKNIVKFDYASLYPSIQLVYDIFPECDVTGAQKMLLKYFRDLRITYKKLASDYEKTDPVLSEMYNRKQLPIKIFINAYFGSLSAPQVFPWGDVDKGETITCIGRQDLRMMIMYFGKKGYEPLVMDTDGVNFTIPDGIEKRKYIGKGLNELVELGKEYEGVSADVAEFNDTLMRNEMGLDIDYFAPSCINISRKNYIIKLIKKGKEKIKLTGNTIKSKKLPQYIVEFLDEGLIHLLNGDGLSFVQLYYDYVEKIFNKQIPLSKIANKSRVKATVAQYREHIKKKTKSGASMSRQAHMELIIQNDYHATLGETIFYINNATKKSQGDVQKVVKKTEKEQRDVIINCYMITEKEMSDNPDMLGEYNVARYLSNFNKRIEPFLVVFNPEIRNDILIDDPKDRNFYTKKQCELTNGYPLKESGQDDFNEVMTLSDSEILFWKKVNKDPYFIYFDDTLKYVDQDWVEKNRKLLDLEIDQIKDTEDLVEYNDDEYAIDTLFDY